MFVAPVAVEMYKTYTFSILGPFHHKHYIIHLWDEYQCSKKTNCERNFTGMFPVHVIVDLQLFFFF